MNKNHLYSILLVLAGLSAVPQVVFASSAAPACFLQLDGDDALESGFFDPDPTSMFLSPSRELVRPLIRAIRLHAEGDDNSAAELIGEFLVDSGEEDFLVLSDKSKGTAISINSVAAKMLGSLPESAIKSYRVRFGVPARQRLSLAIAESDYFEIAQVMKRYPYTDAGVEAAMLMGHYHFDAGRALLAAESFQTALELSNFKSKADPQLSVLTAVSWVLARQPKRAESVMKNLAKTNGGKFRVGDEDIRIDEKDPLSAIKTFVGSGPMNSTSTVDQWLLVGGNTRRTVTTPDGFPVGQPIWQVDVSASEADQREVKSIREAIASDISTTVKGSLVPANVPLIVDGLVLVGNKKQISAVDFKSGKRVWAVAVGADAGADVDQKQRMIPQLRNFQRVQSQSSNAGNRKPWTDFLQGHASSDGKFIFHVVKSLAAPPSDPNNGLRFSRPVGDKTTNALQAIDVLSEGELAWEVGGGQTTGDPRLAQVSFLGAPLPIDGVLYAIGKHLEEIVLVALNSQDGKLVWMQSLAASDGGNGRSRYVASPSNKYHSLTPSYSEGILVCPTGENALVAVDTIGRRVLWGAQNSGGSSSSSSRANSALKPLQNPQVFIENSRVVAFDVSGDARMLAVSLLDGSPLMKTIGKAGVKVQDVLHIASVDESRVVLVEKLRVRAISSNSGRKLWETSIRKFGPPSGRGYVSEKALYLPTEGNAIVKIDLESGDVVDGIQTDHPLGNLILHEGRVISRRETSVSCFELDSKVLAELDQAAKDAGGIEQVAPALKVKQAALLRNQGDVKQAIELLQTIAKDDRSERFKTEFLQSATLLFQSDPEYALTLFKEYESWFQFETDPAMFLGYVELLVKYGMKDDVILQLFKGDSFFTQSEPEADAVLMQRPMTDYNIEATDGGEGEDPEKPESTKKTDKDASDRKKQSSNDEPAFLKNQAEFNKRRISFDKNQWAKAQLIRIARDSPESIPQIQAAIKNRIDSVDLSDAIEKHRFFRQFPLEFVTPQLRFELAEQLIAKAHVAEAENMLASLLGFLPTTSEQIQSAEIVVDGLSKDSFVELWEKIRDNQYGSSVSVVADANLAKPPSVIDYDRVEVKTESVPNQYQRDYPTVVQPRGEHASRLFKDKVLSIWGAEGEFEVLRPTGESETRFKLFESKDNRRTNSRSGSGWIISNHSLAILRQKDLLLALDLSKLDLGQPAVRWQRNVTSVLGTRPEIDDELDLIVNPALRSEDVTASFPTTGCCCFIEKEKLVCVDAFTGETLWTRTRDPKHGNVFANGKHVVTMDAKLTESSVFDLRTGERLRTQSVSDLMESLWDVSGLSFMAVGKVRQRDLDEVKEFEDLRMDLAKPGDDKKKDNKKVSKAKSGRLLSRYDASVGEFVWKKVFDTDAKFCRLSGGRFAVLSKDNHLYIFDSKSGKELANIPSGLTEAQRKKVRYIGGFEHLGNDLIVLASNKTISLSANGYRIQASHRPGTFFTGHLLLLSKDTMESVWNQPAELEGFQLQPMLPSASPLLIFNRRIQSTPQSRTGNQAVAARAPKLGSALQVVAMDMKTGRLVVNEIVDSVGTVRFTAPIVDISAGTIEMKFASRMVKLTLKKSSDEPPSPIASMTKFNPVPENFGKVESVVKVAAESDFDIEESNKRLVKQAEAYEAALEEMRKKERALIKAETGR